MAYYKLNNCASEEAIKMAYYKAQVTVLLWEPLQWQSQLSKDPLSKQSLLQKNKHWLYQGHTIWIK